jgi:hypothetical protein
MGLLLLLGSTGTPFSGALDTLGTGLESGWSVGRRLRAAYTGAIIRVRRSSDNAEQDFSGSGTTGAVDAAAVAAFCGAGDGFLTTIYDQSGNSRNFTQSTTTLQPLVVSGGVANTKNGRLSAAYDGATSSRSMSVASSSSFYNFMHDGTSGTMYCVAEVTNDTNVFKVLLQNTNQFTAGFIYRFTNLEAHRLLVFNNTAETPITVTKTTPTATYNTNTVFIDADNATAASREDVWQDGVSVGGDNSSTTAVVSGNAGFNLFLGTNTDGTGQFAGNVCEVVIWSGDRTANRTTWESNAKTFWGTP